ncbi:hypothetical protein I7G59_19890 [Sinorhizobium meliloti]|uniref:hypothetical protein n=1 Tax=Rhizobium meliloti TaxID=382 RepID=UPI00237FF353|nr:hypothetical protein [Sinorhizobium meliloti]MDE3799568.1 hypothetical protein [Sinorhizobium meliloti]
MEAKTVKRDTVSSQTRREQLWSIMEDAAENVLQRPESRRGPYLIQDNDLKLPKRATGR